MSKFTDDEVADLGFIDKYRAHATISLAVANVSEGMDLISLFQSCIGEPEPDGFNVETGELIENQEEKVRTLMRLLQRCRLRSVKCDSAK